MNFLIKSIRKITHTSIIKYRLTISNQNPKIIQSQLNIQKKNTVPDIIFSDLNLLQHSISFSMEFPLTVQSNKIKVQKIIYTLINSIHFYSPEDLLRFLKIYNSKDKSYRLSMQIVKLLNMKLENLYINLIKSNQIKWNLFLDILQQFLLHFYIKYPTQLISIIKNIYKTQLKYNFKRFLEILNLFNHRCTKQLKHQIIDIVSNMDPQIFSKNDSETLFLISYFEFGLVAPQYRWPSIYQAGLEQALQNLDKCNILDKIYLFNCFRFSIPQKYQKKKKLNQLFLSIYKNFPQRLPVKLLKQLLLTLKYMSKTEYDFLNCKKQEDQILIKLKLVIQNIDPNQIDIWKIYIMLVQYLDIKNQQLPILSQFKQYMIQKILEANTKPRNYLRVLQYLVACRYNPKELIKIINKLGNIYNKLTDIQLIRLWGCIKVLEKNEQQIQICNKNEIRSSFQKILGYSPAIVIQSLNRSFLFNENRQMTKQILTNINDNHIQHHKLFLHKRNIILNTFKSQFLITQFWQKQFASKLTEDQIKHLIYGLIRFFYDDFTHLLPHHLNVFTFLSRISKQSYSQFSIIFKILEQIVQPLLQLSAQQAANFIKYVCLPNYDIFKANLRYVLAIVDNLYNTSPNNYQFESLKYQTFVLVLKYKIDDKILVFIIKTYKSFGICHLTISDLQKYLALEKTNNDIDSILSRIQVISQILKKSENKKFFQKQLQEIQNQIDKNYHLHPLKILFQNNIDKKIVSKALIIKFLTHTSLPIHKNYDFLQYLCKSNEKLNVQQFMIFLHQLNRRSMSKSYINYLIQNLNNIYNQLTTHDKIRVLIYFSSWKYSLVEILQQILDRHNLPFSIVFAFYNLSYFEDRLNKYCLQAFKTKNSFDLKLRIYSKAEEIKILNYFFSLCILNQKYNVLQKKIEKIQFILSYMLEKLSQKQLQSDPRFYICLKIILKRYPQFFRLLQTNKIVVQDNNLQQNVSIFFNRFKQEQQKLLKESQILNFLQKNGIKLRYNFFYQMDQKRDILIFGLRQFRLLNIKNKYVGDFQLAKYYVQTVYQSEVNFIELDRESNVGFIIQNLQKVFLK